MAGTSSDPGANRDAQITIYPDGPMLLRGDVEIVGADGTPLPRRRRCGSSAMMPLCDGTHKLVWKPGRDNARRRGAAAEED